MESTNSKMIKNEFKSFSSNRGFVYYNSDPLVAPSDSKLLFNISGGVKFQNELLGLKETKKEKISSIQKCIRTDGMNSIGYSGRHHLYFEMLGHFMFYKSSEKETKEEFIKFAYEFLTKEIGLDKTRIFATVHPQDEVSLDVWKKLGNKNIIFSDSNVFVSPYADKSALRTEIKWNKNDEQNSLVELWNLVFTQYDSKKIFENPSDKIAADSGASLERIVSAYEDKSNNYENSMWINYITYLASLGKKENIEEYRRLADFLNTSIQMINEGIIPGNKVQPYMSRKIIRSVFDMCDTLGIDYTDCVLEYFKYNTLQTNDIELLKIIKEEYEKYQTTIRNGIAQANKIIRKKGIENIDAKYLKSTCGLPQKYIDLLLSTSSPEIYLQKYLK